MVPAKTVDPSDVSRNAAVIVAHPDDETLWAGGTILMHPTWRWTIVALCRADDPDRAPRFFRAAERMGTSAKIGNLDDGPEQHGLPPENVQQAVLSLLPGNTFDLIVTHSPFGEYTRHLRHEETGEAVVTLWQRGELHADELWMFAYRDAGERSLPRPIATAHRRTPLALPIWKDKYDIITNIYGFAATSFEARTTPHEETFWCFRSVTEFQQWFQREDLRNESARSV